MTAPETNASSLRGAPMLIRNACSLHHARIDVRLSEGVITELGEQLEPQAGETCVDARGGLLLPGLADHHLHLFATAAARASVICGPPEVNNEKELAQALQSSTGTGWLRGIGFHESVYPQLSVKQLDELCPHRPVRIQHRSGMMWMLNTRALEHLRLTDEDVLPEGAECDAAGELTGRFFDLDTWLGERMERQWPNLADVSRELASYGVTQLTDASVHNGPDEWRAFSDAIARGELLQRLQMMGTESLQRVACGDVNAQGQAGREVAIGPVKIYLREIALPPYDELVERIRQAHSNGRAVAAHCVSRVEITYMLAALQEAGTINGDRIEHASVADDDALALMAQLGVTAVTQPHFIAERGDQYLQDVATEDLPILYRAASFFRQGVALGAGSDAPYGQLDPWVAMRAAVARATRSGHQMSPSECLTPRQALQLFAANEGRAGLPCEALSVGQRADLCLMSEPIAEVLNRLDASLVGLTIIAGRIVYRSSRFKFLDEVPCYGS